MYVCRVYKSYMKYTFTNTSNCTNYNIYHAYINRVVLIIPLTFKRIAILPP